MKKYLEKYVKASWLVLCIVFCLMSGMRVNAGGEKPVYKVMINRAANCVTVYEKGVGGGPDVPVKAFVCSVGRAGHGTPLGTFKTSDYYTWRLMVDGSYGQYAVRFNDGIMFHSVPYYTPNAGDMEWEQYNLLGEPASLGCVRLACDDAKWIYENCVRGTEVIVYDDAQNPGPLGKPTEMKLTAENPMKNWDPTNMDAGNPWNMVRPLLYMKNGGVSEVMWLPPGASQLDIYNLFGMMDFTGDVYDVGEYTITLSGKYDLNTAGIYEVSVCGVTALGVRTEKRMTLVVG